MKTRDKISLILIIVIILVLVIVVVVGCTSVSGIEITSSPDNILYIIGVDSELTLDGGLVTVFTGRRGSDFETREIKPMTDEATFSISHDIDFRTEGIFMVDVILNSTDFRASFPVQVVSLEKILDIIEQGSL